MAHQAQVLLGSNMGDRESYLSKAIDIIDITSGRVTQRSRIFVTPAWGITDANDFYNQAISLETELEADQLLEKLLKIEEQLGRIRTNHMTSRTIDLDIAFWEDVIIKTEALIVPHPRLHLRNFALGPLSDIVPEKIHPVLGKSVKELFKGLRDHDEVVILPS